MSNDNDYDMIRRRIANSDASPDRFREAMWREIDRTLGARAARRQRARIATIGSGAAVGVAAALVAGIMIGRSTNLTVDGAAPPAITAASRIDAARSELSTTYRLALGEYFRDAETLLVLFDLDDGTDEELIDLARELASTTRLLMDSRLGEDPAIRDTLLDLELLLIQIARLVDTRDPTERQLVEEGLEESAVLPRLRRLIPRQTVLEI